LVSSAPGGVPGSPSTPHNAVSHVLGVHAWEWPECREAEIRGWDAHGPGPALPSDAASQCPTLRDVYLRRRLGLRLESPSMARGRRLHAEALGVWRAVVAEGLKGLSAAARGVETRAGLWALASAYTWLTSYHSLLPVLVEPTIPGWAGYAAGKPDLVIGPYPVELVTGPPGSPGFEAKKTVLAAYALMLERLTGAPVDLGYIVSLSEGRAYPYCIGDADRQRALTLAEEVANAVEADPGVPGSPSACPPGCPLKSHCWGGAAVEAPSGSARVEARAEEGAG